MTASEHNTDSDSLEHRIHPPLSAERDYRETPPMRNPLRDLRGIPEGTFRADLFYTQAIFRAENSPIPNKLVGRQFTGETLIARRRGASGRVTRRQELGLGRTRVGDQVPACPRSVRDLRSPLGLGPRTFPDHLTRKSPTFPDCGVIVAPIGNRHVI